MDVDPQADEYPSVDFNLDDAFLREGKSHAAVLLNDSHPVLEGLKVMGLWTNAARRTRVVFSMPKSQPIPRNKLFTSVWHYEICDVVVGRIQSETRMALSRWKLQLPEATFYDLDNGPFPRFLTDYEAAHSVDGWNHGNKPSVGAVKQENGEKQAVKQAVGVKQLIKPDELEKCQQELRKKALELDETTIAYAEIKRQYAELKVNQHATELRLYHVKNHIIKLEGLLGKRGVKVADFVDEPNPKSPKDGPKESPSSPKESKDSTSSPKESKDSTSSPKKSNDSTGPKSPPAKNPLDEKSFNDENSLDENLLDGVCECLFKSPTKPTKPSKTHLSPHNGSPVNVRLRMDV